MAKTKQVLRPCDWCDKKASQKYGVRVAGKLFSVCKSCKEEKERERGY